MSVTAMAPELATDLASALDPVRFALATGIRPDDWQRTVLRSNARQQLLLCSRQSGKSTVACLLAAHCAIFRPGSLVIVVSPSLRQSQELYRRIVAAWRATGEPVPADIENRLSLELRNGSRVLSLPGSEKTIRGLSAVDLLLCDEAARVPDETYQAIRPMLAVSRGRLIGLSTPYGRRGWFHREWTEGGPDWHRTRITAHECPRIDPAWLEEERRRLPASVFEQEYLCQFAETDDAAFRYEDIRAALDTSLAPLL